MPGEPTVRALRGATTVEEDTPEQITERMVGLLREIQAQNNLDEEDIISIIFTATKDVVSMFPATAARTAGFGAVPLLCMSEIDVPGATPKCLRVLLHVHTPLSKAELRHVYLHGAQALRDDLPG
jgi:chorismate mutase